MPKHERGDEAIEDDRRCIDHSIKRLKLEDVWNNGGGQQLTEEEVEKEELMKMNKLLGFLHFYRTSRKHPHIENVPQVQAGFNQNSLHQSQIHLSHVGHMITPPLPSPHPNVQANQILPQQNFHPNGYPQQSQYPQPFYPPR